ncbi:MAG: MoaD/ThiS family protein [Acidobacteriia bacterium]|nr:MoaD/ThiS family protein [Terriglobia bacterium]
MPTVFIPTLLQSLTGGRSSVEVEGGTVRQVIDNLEQAWPGIRERLLDQGKLRPNISVAVDGEVTPMGLIEPVSPSSEVHFIAAIKGGAQAAHGQRHL